MKRLLITAFEAFDGRQKNASQEALNLLLKQREKPDRFEVYSICLPVVAGKASEILCEYITRIQPDLVVMLGEAKRDAICLEQIGYNEHRFTIPDNNGQMIDGVPIVSGGADSYSSTLPLPAMLTAIEQIGVPVRLSEDAGRYICNEVLYSALYHIETHSMKSKAGFIHLPHLPEECGDADYPTLATRDAVAALHAAVDSLEQVLA